MVGMFLFYLVQYTVILLLQQRPGGGRHDPAGAGGRPHGSPTGLRIAFRTRIGAILGVRRPGRHRGDGVLRFIQEPGGPVSWGKKKSSWPGWRGSGGPWPPTWLVPVLVHQRLGPIDVVKESAALFRKTWGEQMVGAGGDRTAHGAGGLRHPAPVGGGAHRGRRDAGAPPLRGGGDVVVLTATSLLGGLHRGSRAEGGLLRRAVPLRHHRLRGRGLPGGEMLSGAFQPKR